MDESLALNLDLEDLRWLRRLARQLVQDPDEADDAVQDTVLAALTRPPRSDSAPRGWLAKVLHNVVRQGRRGAARRAAREREWGARDPARSTADIVEELSWHRTLVDQVNALAEPYRSTILLRFLRGRSPRAIAREQGIPVKTVHTRIERGLARLRRALDRGHGGDRSAWMSAVAALAAPVSRGVGTGTLVIGGMAVGTTMKVSVGVLVAAVGIYFVTRTPGAESPRMAAVDPPAAEGELPERIGAADSTAPEGAAAAPGTGAQRRSPIEEDALVGASAVTGATMLRVVLEGITEEDARLARVTVVGVETGNRWPGRIQDSWPCQGQTSEFDLDPFFARMAELSGEVRDDELEIEVDHPLHFSETTRIPLSNGLELESGQTLYEARFRFAEVVFWPELTLAVRDANTLEHLEDVELRCVPTAFMGRWEQPGDEPIFTTLGSGLSSPIVLLGGRKADAPEDLAAGLALRPAPGEAPRPAELVQPEETERGVEVYARAPGYAWGRIVLDVSKGTERELLLEPAATLDVRFANVQLERYATWATLCVARVRPDGGEDGVIYQGLDETLAAEGLLLEALEPGEHVVSVELGGAFSRRKRPVLAREEVSLTAGETRELVLVLADSPAPPERAPLGGVVSFPTPEAFGGEEEVRLQLYQADYMYGNADVELSLADMERVGGALPTWSFHLKDLPVGLYQVRLLPFEKNWMIELPAGGREDVELVIPELAEVRIETVDARTGERIPLEVIRYGTLEDLPGRVHHDWSSVRTSTGFEGEPGTFCFWTTPGAAYVQTYSVPGELDIGMRRQGLELVPGLQSVQFELAPACTLRFEFRVNGAALPTDDGIFTGLGRGIRAIGHDGRASAMTYWIFEASAPGLYEISFEGIGTDRFLPIPPRRVEVRAGETTEVIVDLRRK